MSTGELARDDDAKPLAQLRGPTTAIDARRQAAVADDNGTIARFMMRHCGA
jgi:hypothetical protein